MKLRQQARPARKEQADAQEMMGIGSLAMMMHLRKFLFIEEKV
jgi:hypothetical protein